jgi:hypothetical protein
LRDNIEKGFATLSLSAGARMAKINEYLVGDGVVPEEGAERLLGWCRDEYAKRKSGQPRKKVDNSPKKPAAAPSDRPLVESAPSPGASTPTVMAGPAEGSGADTPHSPVAPSSANLDF